MQNKLNNTRKTSSRSYLTREKLLWIIWPILFSTSWKKINAEWFLGKKKFPSDPSCCPACGVTVRPQELEQHFAQELDRLYKISSASSRARASRSSLPPGHPQDHPHGPMLHAPSTADGTPHGRWETYKRIKANRQVSIRVKRTKS